MPIQRNKIVFSVGGSLIVPDGGVAVDFLKNLNSFIRAELAKDQNRQFFLVVGGERLPENIEMLVGML